MTWKTFMLTLVLYAPLLSRADGWLEFSASERRTPLTTNSSEILFRELEDPDVLISFATAITPTLDAISMLFGGDDQGYRCIVHYSPATANSSDVEDFVSRYLAMRWKGIAKQDALQGIIPGGKKP